MKRAVQTDFIRINISMNKVFHFNSSARDEGSTFAVKRDIGADF